MVPTFGMYDFLTVRVASLAADDAERQAYLSEVTRNSTQFGARSESEARSEAHRDIEQIRLF